MHAASLRDARALTARRRLVRFEVPVLHPVDSLTVQAHNCVSGIHEFTRVPLAFVGPMSITADDILLPLCYVLRIAPS